MERQVPLDTLQFAAGCFICHIRMCWNSGTGNNHSNGKEREADEDEGEQFQDERPHRDQGHTLECCSPGGMFKKRESQNLSVSLKKSLIKVILPVSISSKVIPSLL